MSLTLSLALATGLAACGGDAGDRATNTTATEDGASAGTRAGDACLAFADVTRIFSPTADPASAGATAQAFAAAAPESVADSARVVSEAVHTAFGEDAPAGDPLDTPEFYAALSEAAGFYAEECGPTVDALAVDYAFEGLPPVLPAGETAFHLINRTTTSESHELVLMRRMEGTDGPVEELVGLPNDELFAAVEFVGVAFTGDEAGQQSAAVVDLVAGDYIAVCSLPVGGEEEGEPHFARGMVAEFTVK